jgi:restriction endonuclease S subunit
VSEWTILPISNLTETSQYGTSAKAGSEGSYPILRMGNITRDGHLDLSDLKYIDLMPSELGKYTTRSGDILFNRTNSAELVGKTAVVREEEPYAFAGYLVRLRTNSLADPHYVSAYLNSPNGKRKLRSMAKSIVGMANINARELSSIRIPVPPLDEQRRIAAILDQADALRRKRREALARLSDLVWANFVDAFGDPLAGAQKWPLSRLGAHLVEVTNGLTRRRTEGDQGDDIVLRLRDIRAGSIEFEDPNRITLSEKEKRKYQVRPDDILFIRVNGNPDYVGRCAQFSGFDEDVFFNDHIMRVRVRRDSINPDFLQTFLNSEAGRRQIAIHKKTSAGQHTINQDGLSQIVLSIPPIDRQDRFSNQSASIRTQIRVAEEHLAHLDALFASLQHRAFRGEL